MLHLWSVVLTHTLIEHQEFAGELVSDHARATASMFPLCERSLPRSVRLW